jgi:acyl-coenzyme A thioesterase PaaI-like protein
MTGAYAARMTIAPENSNRQGFEAIREGLPAAVPMVRTMNLAFEQVNPDRVVMVLPDQPAFHNHIGGPHAGALFTLGESASGAFVLGHFGDLLHRATPLAVQSTIRYFKVAMGPIRATALLTRPVDEIREELDAGARPEFDVEIEFTNGVGDITGSMTVTWTLRPNRT